MEEYRLFLNIKRAVITKDYSQQSIMIYLNGYWKKWTILLDLENI